MSDYISREAFLEKERRLYCQDCSRRKNSNGKLVYEIGDAPCRACGIGDVLDDFEDIPAADVRPVVHGKWIKCRKNYSKCSECGTAYSHPVDWTPDKYCSECGARLFMED